MTRKILLKGRSRAYPYHLELTTDNSSAQIGFLSELGSTRNIAGSVKLSASQAREFATKLASMIQGSTGEESRITTSDNAALHYINRPHEMAITIGMGESSDGVTTISYWCELPHSVAALLIRRLSWLHEAADLPEPNFGLETAPAC